VLECNGGCGGWGANEGHDCTYGFSCYSQNCGVPC
jgi:hypothetical protein